MVVIYIFYEDKEGAYNLGGMFNISHHLVSSKSAEYKYTHCKLQGKSIFMESNFHLLFIRGLKCETTYVKHAPTMYKNYRLNPGSHKLATTDRQYLPNTRQLQVYFDGQRFDGNDTQVKVFCKYTLLRLDSNKYRPRHSVEWYEINFRSKKNLLHTTLVSFLTLKKTAETDYWILLCFPVWP